MTAEWRVSQVDAEKAFTVLMSRTLTNKYIQTNQTLLISVCKHEGRAATLDASARPLRRLPIAAQECPLTP